MAGSLDIPSFRIGEPSRRTGVPEPTIRGWERRHGFPRPQRTASGYRLYSERDVALIAQLLELTRSGFAVSQAIARLNADGAQAQPEPVAAGREPELGTGAAYMSRELVDALLRFDAAGAHALLDRAAAAYTAEALVCDIAVPAVRLLGDGYQSATVSIAQEHFASNLVRGRLWNLARGWDRGVGPRLVLAMTAGDHHDLPLLALGLLLRRRGCRITWLGSDLPAAELGAVVDQLTADRVVVGMSAAPPDASEAAHLIAMASAGISLCVAGAAATDEVARKLGARRLSGDLRAIADALVADLGSS